MKTIVSIISAQPTPNYFLIKELFEPGDELLFITSTTMRKNIKPIVDTLAWNNVVISEVILADGEEERWEIMCNRIEKAISKEKQYAVNLTGGTKYMALAVQNVFEKYNSLFYYVPFPKNVILTKDAELPITTRLTVVEYMQLHGHKIKAGNTIRTFEDAKQMLVCFTQVFRDNEFRIIDKLREYRNSDTQISWVETKENEPKKPTIIDLQDFLNRIGFVPKDADKLTKYETQYLTGGWFEEYVYYLVQTEVGVTDIRFGVKLNETNNDLDVVFTKDNRLFVVECKTGIEKGSMLNQIAYKSAALNDFLKGLSSKSYIFALASDNPNWSKIPRSMNIAYYGREYFINESKSHELLASLK